MMLSSAAGATSANGCVCRVPGPARSGRDRVHLIWGPNVDRTRPTQTKAGIKDWAQKRKTDLAALSGTVAASAVPHPRTLRMIRTCENDELWMPQTVFTQPLNKGIRPMNIRNPYQKHIIFEFVAEAFCG